MAQGDFVPTSTDIQGTKIARVGTIDLTGLTSYAAGGVPLSAAWAKFGMSSVDEARGTALVSGTTAAIVIYDKVNDKIQLFQSTDAAAEVNAPFTEIGAVDIHTWTIEMTVRGKKQGNIRTLQN